jgi:hypothetical protein
MKYIKFTYVDAVTGISVASQPAANGPVYPAVKGLTFVWARESAYPTDAPEFFGTCPDDSDTQIDGVLGIFDQGDWENMQSDEMNRRTPDVKAEIMEATQKRLDDFAKTRDYNSILSACTYATSTVPQFKSDGQYCVNARDQTWGRLHTMMSEVEAGTRPMPSGFSDIEFELPVLAWPKV